MAQIEREEMTPTTICPSCGNKLAVSFKSSPGVTPHYEVWCPVGRCPSEAANQGAQGRTEQEAFAALEKAIEAEENAKPETKL